MAWLGFVMGLLAGGSCIAAFWSFRNLDYDYLDLKGKWAVFTLLVMLLFWVVFSLTVTVRM